MNSSGGHHFKVDLMELHFVPVSYDNGLIIIGKNVVSLGPALDPEPSEVT